MSNTKRVVSLALALAMAMSFLPAYAADDMVTSAGHSHEVMDIAPAPTWSSAAMEAAVKNGLLHGDETGDLMPTENLTRAQAAAIMVRALGKSVKEDISAFADVQSGDWFYEELSYAVHMGLFEGRDKNTFDPNGFITRQEMCAVLARALKLEAADKADIAYFADAQDVSDWAAPYVAACVKAGYIIGSDNKLMPQNCITREQFATVMDRMAGKYYTESGLYRGGSGSVIINAPDVTLSNAVIKGDVIIGDGVAEGDVNLVCVYIEGRLIVRGGGINTVSLEDTVVEEVVLAKPAGNVRLLSDQKSEIKEITVTDSRQQVIISAPAEKLNIQGENTQVKVKDVTVKEVEIKAQGSTRALESSTVDTIKVDEKAAETKIENDENSAVKTVDSAADVTITGDGQLSEITGDGNVTDDKGEAPELTGCSHNWSDWAQQADAHTRTCSLCHEEETEPHYGIWRSDNETTHSRQCVVCNYVTTEDHDSVTDSAVPPSCGVPGLTQGSHCGTCGTVLVAQQEVPALEHDFGGQLKFDAEGHFLTCQREGCGEKDEAAKHTFPENTNCEEALKCTECDYLKPAGQHSYGAYVPSETDLTKHERTCSVCFKVDAAPHNAVSDKGKPAACGVPGLTDGSHCDVCS